MQAQLSGQKISFWALAAIISALLSCAGAIADDKNTQIPPPQKGVHHPGAAREVKSRSSDGQSIQELKKPPEMPGVPLPTSKFMWGFDNPSKTGRNMGARYQVPDSGQTVISHYRDLLKGSGWRILEEASGPKRVFATNDRYRASVTVAIMGTTKTGGSDVDFTYGIRQ